MSFTPGSTVMVQWSDGNQYPATVVQSQQGHVLVSFPNGQQQWIDAQYLSGGAQPQQVGSVQSLGDLDVDGHIEVYDSAQEYMAELQRVVHQVESQGVPLCGVDPNDPVTLWSKVFALNDSDAQGIPRDQSVRQWGFSGEDHFGLVMQYVEAKHSYIGQDDEGQPAVLQRPEWNNAMLQASMGQMQQAQAAAADANPELLAPVAGVSIELWAKASVAMASLGEGATVDMMARKLAELGLDRATYDTATEGWMAKMQGDTTGAIATKYGAAFGQAQTSATPDAGGAPDGEPCSFDRYCEISAAMGAWSDQGFDTNAKMKEVFGIDAVGFSRYSTYWSSKMMSDMSMFTEQDKLMTKYREKYAGADLDADLVL